MDKVCAVIDCQGFLFSDRFIAREVAITSEYFSQCMELNPEIDWKDLIDDEINIVNYTTNMINGLHLMPFNQKDYAFIPSSDDLEKGISVWYDQARTDDKYLVAFKNANLQPILEKLEIPKLNLDDKILDFKSIRELNKKYGFHYLCAYHKRPPKGVSYTCAYRKTNHIYREIKNILEKV